MGNAYITCNYQKRIETTRRLPHQTASGAAFRADKPPRSYIVLTKINESIIVVFYQHSFERLKWTSFPRKLSGSIFQMQLKRMKERALICILGDPGAVSRAEEIFGGESLL